MTQTRLALLLSALALCAGFAPTATAAEPTARASKACKLTLSQQRNAGATYLVSLNVSGVSCSTGLKVEKAWQACRRSTAGRTTCRRRVSRYSCKQSVLAKSKTQYDARVTCKRGSRVVKFIYTQNR
jgi:hypothetical protein